VNFHTFLNTELHGGEWSASHPGPFAPEERDSGTHFIGWWLGIRASVEWWREKLPLWPCREWNPGQAYRPVTKVSYSDHLSNVLKLTNWCIAVT